MFALSHRIAWGLLYNLLLTASGSALLYSQLLSPLITTISSTTLKMPLFGPLVAPLLTPAVGSLAATTAGSALTTATQYTRVALAVILWVLAGDVRDRALQVEAEKPDKVFAYYMHIWNIFYASYLMLPLLRV